MNHRKRRTTKKLMPLRVFVLGAGVSAACGIPVTKDIFRETMLVLLRSSPSRAEKVHTMLRYLYPGFEARLKNYPNMEDFPNLLEMAKRFNSEEFLKREPHSEKRIKKVEDIVLKSLTSFLWQSMQSKDRLKPLRTFVEKQLRPGDVVITFNWDVSLEQALYMDRKEPRFDYFYSRTRDQKQVFLIKPHGSFDWVKRADLPGGGKSRDYLPLDKRLVVFKHFDLEENRELEELMPIIVPPISSKEFNYDALKQMWNSIFRAVSQATDLHIIGYSLPREDQFARFVFRRAIRQNLLYVERNRKKRLAVRVVNPNEAVWTTFSRLVGAGGANADMEFKQTMFQDYVSASFT
jgi:hypothetical protein